MRTDSRLGMRLAAGLALTASLALGGGASAQEPAAICDLLTEQEIAAVTSADLVVTSSDETSCTWDDSTSGGGATVLSLSVLPGSLSDYASAYPDAAPAQVAGQPALAVDEGTVLVDTGSGHVLLILLYSFAPDGSPDAAAAIAALAELALGRLPGVSLPTPAPVTPGQSFAGDTELAGLFPDEVAGQPLEVQTLTLNELVEAMGSQDEDGQEGLQLFNVVLALHGRTAEDVTLGFAFFTVETDFGSLNAIRIRGAQAADLVEELWPIIIEDIDDPQRSDVQVAGRDLIRVTEGAGGEDAETQHVLASGEVVWVISAEEPVLSEIVAALP